MDLDHEVVVVVLEEVGVLQQIVQPGLGVPLRGLRDIKRSLRASYTNMGKKRESDHGERDCMRVVASWCVLCAHTKNSCCISVSVDRATLRAELLNGGVGVTMGILSLCVSKK